MPHTPPTTRTATTRTAATLATAALVAAGLVGAGLVASPAQAKPKPKPIVLATSTPAIDAAGGQAAFSVTGLPKGSASLQMLDPATKKWVTKAPVRRASTTGSVVITGVPQGVPQFRVAVGKRTSNVVPIKAYGVYTFADLTKSHTFGSNTIASRDLNLPSYKVLKVPAAAACELIDLGLEMSSPQPNWRAEIAAQSAVQPAPVVQIMATPSEVKTDSKMGQAISGPLDIVVSSSTSNGQQFFAWIGVQVHCLADPMLTATVG